MSDTMHRRTFLKAAGTGLVATGFGPSLVGCASGSSTPRSPSTQDAPSYLRDVASEYQNDPRQAAREWFAQARFGLFIHMGISSMLGRGEWVQYRENIPLAEYERLADEYNPNRFDADFITDLALDAEMKYITITSRHHDSYCLFESKVSEYSTVNSPARRDLMAELAEQCAAKGLGLFFYYSYALDWHHPYFYPRSYYPIARPDYPDGEPRYLFRQDEDFAHYIDFVHTQIRELLKNYGPIAGMWFDPIMGFYARPHLFPIEDTYALVRSLQPQVLISFKQGATGTEDFAAPERGASGFAEHVRKRVGPEQAAIAARAWDGNKKKHNESCNTLQPHGWGYIKADDGQHKTADDVMKLLADNASRGWNLLLNTGPLPDGSIHSEDVATLREVGRRIRADGWPGA